MAGIAYAGGSQTTIASRTSFSFTYPNAPVGSVVFAYFQIDNGPTVTGPASGWTLIETRLSPNTTRGELWYHRLAAGEGGTTTPSWTWSGANFSQGAIDAYSGLPDNPADPQDAASTDNAGASTSPATVTGLTTVTDAAWCLGFFFAPDISATHSSSDFTNERRDASSVALYDLIKTPAGATGNKSIAISPTTSNDWVTFMVALRPQPALLEPGTKTWEFPHPPMRTD